MQKSNFNLVSLVVIVVLLGLLVAVLFPAISMSQIRSDSMHSFAARGRDIYVAITSANTEREPLGLPPVWPQSNPPTNNAVDISQMNFTNSTDYFWTLYDGDRFGTAQHDPYVKGFDFSRLAGAGVSAHSGQGRLKPKNNLWTIAKNLREEMDDIVPVLLTRNLAAESLASDVTDPALFNRRLFFDEEWKTPFGDKWFVIVRKGGGTFNGQARYMTYRVLYNSQTFKTTIDGSQRPGLCYLTPSKEVMPSEDVYQACATSTANTQKGYWYYWVKDEFGGSLSFIKYVLLMGLISGALIFFRVLVDKKLKDTLSVMEPVYWILLWLAVTMYMCFPVMKYLRLGNLAMLLAVVLALVFQVGGCLYVANKRKIGNMEGCQMAFGLMLLAPVLAVLCIIIAVVLSPLKYFLALGLVSGIYILARVSDNKKLNDQLSLMGPFYWSLLWLSVTAYMYCPVMVYMDLHHLSWVPIVTFAFACQVLGCLYLVVWKRSTGNLKTFGRALFTLLAAPVIAFYCVLITAFLAPFVAYCWKAFG